MHLPRMGCLHEGNEKVHKVIGNDCLRNITIDFMDFSIYRCSALFRI